MNEFLVHLNVETTRTSPMEIEALIRGALDVGIHPTDDDLKVDITSIEWL